MRLSTFCKPSWLRTTALILSLAAFSGGCRVRSKAPVDTGMPACSDALQKIYYPEASEDFSEDHSDLMTAAPMTLTTFMQTESWDITLDEAIRMALTNSRVLQRLGGTVVNAPQAVSTTFDPALLETNPLGGVEAALSQFDAQVASSLFFNHNERKFNNAFQALFSSARNDSAQFQFEMSKQTAVGTRFAVRNLTDYTNNHIEPFRFLVPPGDPNRSAFLFNSVYNTVNQFEIRQPLLQGAGAMVNRIAGPNAIPGQYNGVMIARIRSDISLADFESAVNNLVRDVERNYWELYFAYRDLDTKIAARNSARDTWENRQIRRAEGMDRPDEEAQARQQYYTFEFQVQNALSGNATGQTGLLGTERNMRRLLGLTVNDGRLLRPITEPAIAPVVFDWSTAQEQALNRRVELRRQKWSIKQRELELMAARQLNIWRLDMVGQYGFRGFGDNLFGSRNRVQGDPNSLPTPGSAVEDLWGGDLDDWQVGFDMRGPIGMRQGHLAVRNAELQLIREKTVLREQQRQILHDLGGAYTEVDRALANIKTSYNAHLAIQEELEPKRLRVEAGKDQIFFLLDAQQRLATAESAFYRSIVDYNLSLLNFIFSEGTLLQRYNVFLNEGSWDENLQSIARDKAGQFDLDSRWGVKTVDLQPVSTGPFDQQGAVLSSSSNSANDVVAPQEPAVPGKGE